MKSEYMKANTRNTQYVNKDKQIKKILYTSRLTHHTKHESLLMNKSVNLTK